MEYREKIIALAQSSPILPGAVAKALNTNSIMAGAMLSEMCAKGLLKTSALKVGGSPLYYVPGNEAQLLKHLESLNEKDRRTVLKLKEEKIIRENEADPLTRVSLAQIKDFARPLTVSYQDKQEIFWKWFEIGDKEAEELIAKKLEPVPEPRLSAPLEKKAPEPAIPEQTKLAEVKVAAPSGDFWERINSFLKTNGINFIERSVVKKKTEFDLLIELQSPVGALTYYCKARSKKKITDADISAAYVQGQIKKLPTIFLTDGELTKQAQSVLAQLKGITFKKV